MVFPPHLSQMQTGFCSCVPPPVAITGHPPAMRPDRHFYRPHWNGPDLRFSSIPDRERERATLGPVNYEYVEPPHSLCPAPSPDSFPLPAFLLNKYYCIFIIILKINQCYLSFSKYIFLAIIIYHSLLHPPSRPSLPPPLPGGGTRPRGSCGRRCTRPRPRRGGLWRRRGTPSTPRPGSRAPCPSPSTSMLHSPRR